MQIFLPQRSGGRHDVARSAVARLTFPVIRFLSYHSERSVAAGRGCYPRHDSRAALFPTAHPNRPIRNLTVSSAPPCCFFVPWVPPRLFMEFPVTGLRDLRFSLVRDFFSRRFQTASVGVLTNACVSYYGISLSTLRRCPLNQIM